MKTRERLVNHDTGIGLRSAVALLGAFVIAPALSAGGPPVASDDQAFHQGGTFLAIDVLANDVEPDGEAVQVEMVGTTCSIQPASPDDFGLVTLTPEVGAPESCTLTYRLRDESGTVSNTATVNIGVPSHLIFRDDCELGNNSRWDNYVVTQ